MKLVPTDTIEKKSALVQIMGWRQTGGKSLPEPVMTQLVTRCHWVNSRSMLNDKMPLAALISIWHHTDLSMFFWLQMRIGHVSNVMSGIYPVQVKTPSYSIPGLWCGKVWRTWWHVMPSRENDGPAMISLWAMENVSFQDWGHNKYLIIGHRLLSSRLSLSYP